MSTDNTTETLKNIGFAITVIHGPLGCVRDNWPNIKYTVLITQNGDEVWSGPYSLGVGHVKWPIRHEDYPENITQDICCALNTVRKNPHAELKDKKLWARTAALLAKHQNVKPKLCDVICSIILEGNPYFNGLIFEEWALEYGYDTDSRKAESTYNLCMETGRALKKNISATVLKKLQDLASNY